MKPTPRCPAGVGRLVHCAVCGQDQAIPRPADEKLSCLNIKDAFQRVKAACVQPVKVNCCCCCLTSVHTPLPAVTAVNLQ
uniref:Uncharacterized protein n=1 Tax=Phasianus colchicus TaxID=9054 RepID=A0A669PL98_PHACC